MYYCICTDYRHILFIITVCAPSDYSHPLMYYSIHTDHRHILFYHYCMCTLRLQPSTHVLQYSHRLQAHTLLSLLYVHPQTTAIHSCITVFAQTTGTYTFIITACAPSDYSHPLMYYSIRTDYRHILFYHYCMCTLRLQPSNLVSILYMHPWTTTIYSSIITVCA